MVTVTDTFIKATYNNETTVKYPKVLFAGVYAALLHGSPFIYSNVIKPIVDTTIEHKLIGARKLRNIYFKLNKIGESYVELFKAHYQKA